MERIFHRTKEELLGKNLFSAFPELRIHQVEPYLRKALQGESTSIKQVKSELAGIWFQVDYFPLFNEKNRVIGGLAVLHEEPLINESSGHLFPHVWAPLYEAAGTGHWLLRLKTNQVCMDVAGQKLLEVSPEQVPLSRKDFLSLFKDPKELAEGLENSDSLPALVSLDLSLLNTRKKRANQRCIVASDKAKNAVWGLFWQNTCKRVGEATAGKRDGNKEAEY